MNEQHEGPAMKVLDETDVYLVGCLHEDAYIIEKQNFNELIFEDFYGDPGCGLISRNNDWIILAGDHLLVWKKDGQVFRPQQEGLDYIHAMRTQDQRMVALLIDPWSEHAAIWTLDVVTMAFTRVRDFHDYKDKPYTENVVW